jgi:CRISPR-associated exonuclease Cas4
LKLRRFAAERYRSLKSFELDVDDFLVLIGANNHGKSNFFYALKLFLSGSAREVCSEVFFNRETKEPIRLTATFEDLSSQESEKLSPWMVEKSLTVQKEYSVDDGKVTLDYYALMKVPEDAWLGEDFEDYNDRTVVSQLPIVEYLPKSGRISREAYADAIKKYIETNKGSVRFRTELRKNPAGFKGVLDGYLPELHLVPAVRDVTDETKASTESTLLGRLVALVVERIAQHNPSFQQVKASLESVKVMIEGTTPESKMPEIRELEERITRELPLWDVDVKIGIEAPDPKSVFALGTKMVVDDGLSTDISQKGHGLQRALLFALMRIWARAISEQSTDQRQRSNIFAFEEPELFLHPQICRLTYDALKKISEVDQVLLCSHSPHFVSLEDYKNIVVVRKESQQDGTKAYRVRQDLFEADFEQKRHFNMIQFFNPDRNELFFSRKVVLTEGATEKALFPLLAKRIGVFDHRVSIIDCNSKFNLSLYVKVLNAFRLPYLVIHDEDPVDPDLEPGRPKHSPDKLLHAKRVYQENTVIGSSIDNSIGIVHVVRPELETLLQIPKARVEEVGKPYASVEKFQDDRIAIPQEVEEIVRLVFS